MCACSCGARCDSVAHLAPSRGTLAPSCAHAPTVPHGRPIPGFGFPGPEAEQAITEEKERHKKQLAGLEADLRQVEDERTHALAGTAPDTRRLATHVVEVTGMGGRGAPSDDLPDPKNIIADAVADIAAGAPKLRERYFGRKFYSGYDQREDHLYNYGPKHGTIVFSVGLTQEARKRLNDGGELTGDEKDAAITYLLNLAKAGVA